MMQPILTLIIPVYNVEKYLEKCISSCYDQSTIVKDIEVILVNDGSTDNSGNICNELKKKYDNLKVIHQKNKGLSGARNTGLLHAKGSYIWFIDSDDWLDEDCIPKIIPFLDKNPDLLWIGHKTIANKMVVKQHLPKSIPVQISGCDLFINHLQNQFYIWKFIYNRTFLLENALKFHEGLYYEDLEFTPRALEKAKKCMLINMAPYNYLIRKNSIANNITKKNVIDRFYIVHKFKKMIQETDMSIEFRSELKKTVNKNVWGTLKLAARKNVSIESQTFNLGGTLIQNEGFQKFSKGRLHAYFLRAYYISWKLIYSQLKYN